MAVLVTGGAGFIGSELTRQLACQVHHVRVIDNLINGRRENIEDLLGDGVELVVEDIRNAGRMAALMKDIDCVFHLACLGVRHSIHSPLENHEVNASATLGLLIAARESAVKRFVYVSSSEVYGSAQWVPMTEDHPTFPMTVYGASKLAGECYTRAFNRTYDYPTVVIRPFNSYGPRCHHEGDSGEVIPRFMLRAMVGNPMIIFGSGTQTRDFTFVSDTARGIMLAGFADRAIGRTINIGQAAEVSINELAERISRLVRQDAAEVIYQPPRPGDVARLFADSRLATELMGYAPCVSLEQGLTQLKQWYEESGYAVQDLLKEEIVTNWEATD